MEDAPKLLKIPKSEGPDIWIRLPRHSWPKSWSSMEDPVVLLERNLYGHLLAGLLWEKHLRKSYCNTVGRWFTIGNAYSYTVKKVILSVYVDHIKLAGRKQNIDPMWNVLNEEVELGDPNIFP